MAMLYVDASLAHSENNMYFKSLREACLFAKPGDTIDVISSTDNEISLKGKPNLPIIIKGRTCLDNVTISNSQYVEFLLDCNNLTINDCMGLSIMACKIKHIIANNLGLSMLCHIAYETIKINGGGDITIDCEDNVEIVNCSKITKCLNSNN